MGHRFIYGSIYDIMAFGDNMKQLEISCTIRTSEDEHVIQTKGQLKNKRLTFIDEDQIKHFIIFERNRVMYIRQGSVDMKYAFQENLLTKGTFRAESKMILLDIRTRSLIREPNRLYIQYELLQDKQVVHEASIEVLYHEI